MKLLIIGALAGLVLGVVLTVLFFSIASFFSANVEARNRSRNAAETKAPSEDTLLEKKIKAHAAK